MGIGAKRHADQEMNLVPIPPLVIRNTFFGYMSISICVRLTGSVDSEAAFSYGKYIGRFSGTV